MEYKAEFYENNILQDTITKEFNKLCGGHTYQYYDFEHDNKRVFISPTAPHPAHTDRWDIIIGEKNNRTFMDSDVLDLGGAEGFYSIKASILGANSVTMVERSAKSVECAKFIADFFGIKNIEFVICDIKDFDFKRKYDIIFLMRIIHWFEKKDRIVLLKNVSNNVNKMTFINLDGEMIDEIIITTCYDYKYVLPKGNGFMGVLELWR